MDIIIHASKSIKIILRINQRYGNLTPPSNLQVVPVAYGFSMIDFTARANSCDSPNLPKGVVFSNCCTIFYCKLPPIGVLKMPGAIVITLILNFPKSLAIGNVIPRIAPLLAA